MAQKKKWTTVHSTTEQIKSLLDSNPENVERFLASHRYGNIGNMVGSIAHTFNNVLGGILGYSQLLKEEVADDSVAYRHACVIESAAKRAANLVSQIYTISNRQGTNDFRIVDPQKLVDDVVALIKSSFPPNLTIHSAFNHANARIRVDYTSMCQVLLNICLNARDAMPEGGELTITTFLTDKTKSKGEPAERPGEQIVFKISDTGMGISEDVLPHIFDAFFSTRETKIAGGLGLTIARAIVKDQGGDIHVETHLGKGTLVAVWLPADQAQPVVQEVSSKPEEQNGREQVIMVVDDEEDIRDLAKSIFERKGYRVLLADSGDSAVRVFEENHDDIGLIILDVAMPGLSTEQVYWRLKERNGNAKIILTSGHTRYSANLQFLKETSDPFLQKPWDLPELVNEVKRLLR
ncbi:MAG TPA: ATP-binding protein [bacterium]